MLARYENLEQMAIKMLPNNMSRKQKAIAKAYRDYHNGIDSNPFTEPYTAKAYDDAMQQLKAGYTAEEAANG